MSAFCSRSSPEFINTATETAGRGDGVDEGLERQKRVLGETGEFGVGALGVGLSSTVMEELDEIERACSQRCSALKEEEPFVGTLSLGKDESPVAV